MVSEKRAIPPSVWRGKSRAMDNIMPSGTGRVERLCRTVKYEEGYLHDYGNVREARKGLHRYFKFYNKERIHCSLGYLTPQEVYFRQGRIYH